MAVVAQPRKNGSVVFQVVTRWRGHVYWENAGTVRRAAEALSTRRLREKKNGTYSPPRSVAGNKLTIRRYAEEVEYMRRLRVRDAKGEMGWVRHHVFNRPWLADVPMADVRPPHFDRLVHELKTNTINKKPMAPGEKPSDRRTPLSDKSINNVIHGLRAIFRAAVRADLIDRQPVELEPKTLNLRPAQEREPYPPADVRALLDHPDMPQHEQLFCAMAFYTGMRLGEICGRRIGDIVTAPGLMAMNVKTQYDGEPLKTGNPRVVPIHPELFVALSAWLSQGLPTYARRAPKPEDFIIPNLSPRSNDPCHTRKTGNAIMKRCCELAGVKYRSTHSTRHTFISAARRAGANQDWLSLITHNPRGKVMDQYTHTDWEPLCGVVKLVAFDLHQTLHFPGDHTSPQGALSGLEAMRKHAKDHT